MSTEDAGSIGVTIKYGKGYDESWLTFRGSIPEVKSNLIECFGLDSEASAELTLNEVTVNATRVAHGLAAVANGLGGTVIPSSQAGKAEPGKKAPAKKAPAKAKAADKPAEPKADEAQQPSGSDPWEDGAQDETPTETAPAEPTILDKIEACTDATALKLLWSKNQDAFKDSAVMDAWKAKGKSFS